MCELVDELRRYARGESYDKQRMADLESEAIDFRAASESFAPWGLIPQGATALSSCTGSLSVELPREVGIGMTRQFDVVVERDSKGYFVASVLALPVCHTQAKSLDELMSRVRE